MKMSYSAAARIVGSKMADPASRRSPVMKQTASDKKMSTACLNGQCGKNKCYVLACVCECHKRGI